MYTSSSILLCIFWKAKVGRMLWSSSYTTIVMCLGLGSAHPRILYEGPSVYQVDVSRITTQVCPNQIFPDQVCPATFAPTQVCPDPNLPKAKFAQTQVCLGQICPDPYLPEPNSPRAKFALKEIYVSKNQENCQISIN